MFVKQLSVFVENKQGALSDVVALLSENGINMRAISIADTQDFGVLRMIVQDCEKAKAVLKAEKVIVAVNEVVAVELADKFLGKMLFSGDEVFKPVKVLSGGGVNVEYMYAFVNPVKQSSACVVLRATDNEKAAGLLKERNIPLISQEELDAI